MLLFTLVYVYLYDERLVECACLCSFFLQSFAVIHSTELCEPTPVAGSSLAT